ncbi:FUSC family protein [Desertibacillus haloalkaliphilus]|uniref:FUSC family protein n=1 Tax=Desertibacillus haloalkaliphilus TaxID=1328930 RepID=UPI001C26C144|nr:aromatic acid exporter family protein [Desertibacillus haloalkaliphilus]MBU8908856.1 aromatic acid exporter family protein [Desertibacillus haloalkaliphilus]
MKLGARIFKTGLAVALSLYLATFLGFEPAMFAALAATFAIQPSIHRTFQTILEQVQANIIGAVLAVIFVITLGDEPFVIGLVIVIAIAIVLKLKLEPSTIPLAIVTVIIIMESPSENFVEFASLRFLLILIGVLAAFIVNLVFIPPRYETKLYYKNINLTEEIIRWINLATRHDADPQALKKDITKLNDNMIKLENLYLFYKEERNYFLKTKYGKARKVVLFRQMLLTSKKALFVLKNLERRTHVLQQMPESLQRLIQTQLDELTIYHDRILLRYVGKVNSETTTETIDEVNSGSKDLTELFMDYYNHPDINREDWLHVFPVISQILEYHEQLEHFDHLVETFFNYHKEDNQANVQEPEDDH